MGDVGHDGLISLMDLDLGEAGKKVLCLRSVDYADGILRGQFWLEAPAIIIHNDLKSTPPIIYCDLSLLSDYSQKIIMDISHMVSDSTPSGSNFSVVGVKLVVVSKSDAGNCFEIQSAMPFDFFNTQATGVMALPIVGLNLSIERLIRDPRGQKIAKSALHDQFRIPDATYKGQAVYRNVSMSEMRSFLRERFPILREIAETIKR